MKKACGSNSKTKDHSKKSCVCGGHSTKAKKPKDKKHRVAKPVFNDNGTIGMRVGAIQKMDEETVHLFGYGVYDGDLEVPDNPGWFNPRITLDSGKIVWGYQCWWGSEGEVKSIIANKTTIIEVQP